tara:strand:+ start:189 stop:530 length:342 start_codon:yes stop_codon:yes gene_type:complete
MSCETNCNTIECWNRRKEATTTNEENIRKNRVRMPMSMYLMKLKCKNSSHDQGRTKDLFAGKVGSKHGSYDRYLSRKMSNVLEKAGELKGCIGCELLRERFALVTRSGGGCGC